MKSKLVALIGVFLLWPLRPAAADQPLVWNTAYGLVNFNLNTTEAGLGYDGINKKAVGIASLPVYTTPYNVLALQLGVDGAWPTGNASLIEPYVAAGHDVLREIPSLKDYTSAHLNVFGRWDSTNGKPGVGASFTYALGGTPVVETAPASAAPGTPPATSMLNLRYQSAPLGPRA